MLQARIVPVVIPLTSDFAGNIYNTNADTVSVQVAKACGAKGLALVTKVGGVFKDIEDPSSRFSSLSVEEAKAEIGSGVIQGGMIPKLEEGFKLLEGDLESFHIVGTQTKETIVEELKKPGKNGTAIVR